ncbi:unnamed protein product, partial [Staurois parvus]
MGRFPAVVCVSAPPTMRRFPAVVCVSAPPTMRRFPAVVGVSAPPTMRRFPAVVVSLPLPQWEIPPSSLCLCPSHCILRHLVRLHYTYSRQMILAAIAVS